MKVTLITKKQIQRASDKALKTRISINMLAQRICELQEKFCEAKSFKLENDELFYELENRKRDEIMAVQRFSNELPTFRSMFYKSKLKDCQSAAAIKALFKEMTNI